MLYKKLYLILFFLFFSLNSLDFEVSLIQESDKYLDMVDESIKEHDIDQVINLTHKFAKKASKFSLTLLEDFKIEIFLHIVKSGDRELARRFYEEFKVALNTCKDQYTPLMVASENCDLKMVDFLVHEGADVNSANSKGLTPLMLAAQKGDCDLINYLLDQGANIHAVSKNWINSNNYINALVHASNFQKYQAIEYLLKRGASFDTCADFKDMFEHAVKYSITALAQVLIGTSEVKNALSSFEINIEIFQHANCYTLQKLIESGLSPNYSDERGKTLLMYAVQQYGVNHTLLRNNADINLKDSEGCGAVEYAHGRSPYLQDFLASLENLNDVNKSFDDVKRAINYVSRNLDVSNIYYQRVINFLKEKVVKGITKNGEHRILAKAIARQFYILMDESFATEGSDLNVLPDKIKLNILMRSYYPDLCSKKSFVDLLYSEIESLNQIIHKNHLSHKKHSREECNLATKLSKLKVSFDLSDGSSLNISRKKHSHDVDLPAKRSKLRLRRTLASRDRKHHRVENANSVSVKSVRLKTAAALSKN